MFRGRVAHSCVRGFRNEGAEQGELSFIGELFQHIVVSGAHKNSGNKGTVQQMPNMYGFDAKQEGVHNRVRPQILFGVLPRGIGEGIDE
jgi:hypothetical protein